METDKKIVEQRILARMRLLQSHVEGAILEDFSIEILEKLQGEIESFIDKVSLYFT